MPEDKKPWGQPSIWQWDRNTHKLFTDANPFMETGDIWFLHHDDGSIRQTDILDSALSLSQSLWYEYNKVI